MVGGHTHQLLAAHSPSSAVLQCCDVIALVDHWVWSGVGQTVTVSQVWGVGDERGR